MESARASDYLGSQLGQEINLEASTPSSAGIDEELEPWLTKESLQTLPSHSKVRCFLYVRDRPRYHIPGKSHTIRVDGGMVREWWHQRYSGQPCSPTWFPNIIGDFDETLVGGCIAEVQKAWHSDEIWTALIKHSTRFLLAIPNPQNRMPTVGRLMLIRDDSPTMIPSRAIHPYQALERRRGKKSLGVPYSLTSFHHILDQLPAHNPLQLMKEVMTRGTALLKSLHSFPNQCGSWQDHYQHLSTWEDKHDMLSNMSIAIVGLLPEVSEVSTDSKYFGHQSERMKRGEERDLKRLALKTTDVCERLRIALHVIEVDQQLTVCCRHCEFPFVPARALPRDGPLANFDGQFVNRHGFRHNLLLANFESPWREHLVLQGPPSTEDSWFPDFAWIIVGCGSCFGHLGWLFVKVDEELSGTGESVGTTGDTAGESTSRESDGPSSPMSTNGSGEGGVSPSSGTEEGAEDVETSANETAQVSMFLAFGKDQIVYK